jgi:hypothetical protein
MSGLKLLIYVQRVVMLAYCMNCSSLRSCTLDPVQG